EGQGREETGVKSEEASEKGGSEEVAASRRACAFLEVSRRQSYPTRMSDSPVALLRAHARHAPWNGRGLAAHATSLVDAAGMRPTNASAPAPPPAEAGRCCR